VLARRLRRAPIRVTDPVRGERGSAGLGADLARATTMDARRYGSAASPSRPREAAAVICRDPGLDVIFGQRVHIHLEMPGRMSAPSTG